MIIGDVLRGEERVYGHARGGIDGGEERRDADKMAAVIGYALERALKAAAGGDGRDQHEHGLVLHEVLHVAGEHELTGGVRFGRDDAYLMPLVDPAGTGLGEYRRNVGTDDLSVLKTDYRIDGLGVDVELGKLLRAEHRSVAVRAHIGKAHIVIYMGMARGKMTDGDVELYVLVAPAANVPGNRVHGAASLY